MSAEPYEQNYKAATLPNEIKDSISYTDVSHAKELLAILEVLRNQEELCDVVLVVGSVRINAHRAVLASSSAYFRAMFTGGLRENNLKEVTLHIKEVDAFQQIINYFYTAKLDIKESNVQELIAVGGLLQLRKIQQSCCEFIRRKINPDNCLGISAFADSHSCAALANIAHQYAINHFVEVVQSDEFVNISFEQLSKLLADDVLNVHSEERVFEAVVAWIKNDVDARTAFAGDLFPLVRFSLLSPEFLMDRVAHEDIIRGCQKCCDLLFKTTEYLLLPKRRSQSSLARVLPRKAASTQQVLYAVGGMRRREALKSAERYDPKEGRWKTIGDMNICRFGADVSSFGTSLLICGGSDDASRLNTAERYDSLNNVWINITPMTSKRNGVGVTMCNGRIYAIGGFDGSTPLNTVECYDPKSSKWSEIGSMTQARFGVGCCSLDEMIYAIGGSDGNNLSSCERYHPESDRWMEISPMNVARKQVACAALGSYVYAIGGADNSGRYQSVERFDPSTDQWVNIAPLLSPRSGAGVGALDGFLYVCGGFDGNQYLNTVEKYDPLTNRWYSAPPMNHARDCVAVCIALNKKTKRSLDFHPRSASPSPGDKNNAQASR